MINTIGQDAFSVIFDYCDLKTISNAFATCQTFCLSTKKYGNSKWSVPEIEYFMVHQNVSLLDILLQNKFKNFYSLEIRLFFCAWDLNKPYVLEYLAPTIALLLKNVDTAESKTIQEGIEVRKDKTARFSETNNPEEISCGKILLKHQFLMSFQNVDPNCIFINMNPIVQPNSLFGTYHETEILEMAIRFPIICSLGYEKAIKDTEWNIDKVCGPTIFNLVLSQYLKRYPKEAEKIACDNFQIFDPSFHENTIEFLQEPRIQKFLPDQLCSASIWEALLNFAFHTKKLDMAKYIFMKYPNCIAREIFHFDKYNGDLLNLLRTDTGCYNALNPGVFCKSDAVKCPDEFFQYCTEHEKFDFFQHTINQPHSLFKVKCILKRMKKVLQTATNYLLIKNRVLFRLIAFFKEFNLAEKFDQEFIDLLDFILTGNEYNDKGILVSSSKNGIFANNSGIWGTVESQTIINCFSSTTECEPLFQRIIQQYMSDANTDFDGVIIIGCCLIHRSNGANAGYLLRKIQERVISEPDESKNIAYGMFMSVFEKMVKKFTGWDKRGGYQLSSFTRVYAENLKIDPDHILAHRDFPYTKDKKISKACLPTLKDVKDFFQVLNQNPLQFKEKWCAYFIEMALYLNYNKNTLQTLDYLFQIRELNKWNFLGRRWLTISFLNFDYRKVDFLLSNKKITNTIHLENQTVENQAVKFDLSQEESEYILFYDAINPDKKQDTKDLFPMIENWKQCFFRNNEHEPLPKRHNVKN